MTAELEFIVGFNSCNSNLELSNQAALSFFLDVATYHGMLAGDDITKVDTRWLLVAYHVKFFKRPKYGRMIKLRTWGRIIRGVVSCREFEIRDENDELLCIAISDWAFVNKKLGKLVRVPQELIDKYDCEASRTNFNLDKVEKLLEPEGMTYIKKYCADRIVLDANLHVNNGKYLAIADTVIPDEMFNLPEADEFIINYKKEIFYKEEVDCYFKQNENTYTVVLKSNDSINAIVKYIR